MFEKLGSAAVAGLTATVALASATILPAPITDRPTSSIPSNSAAERRASTAPIALAQLDQANAKSGSSSASSPKSPSLADKSYYFTTRDGTRLALSLYFPPNIEALGRVPTIFVQTRYGRAVMIAGVPDYSRFRAAGYAVAVVDVRGTTASFGTREAETGPLELADTDELVAHLSSQPWSNGQLIAHGISYMGNTADFATGRQAPGLIGSIPRQVDFDAYRHVAMPGGIANEYLLRRWSAETLAMDEGRYPNPDKDCRLRVEDCGAQFPFLTPIDGEQGLVLAHQAVQKRNRWTYEDFAGIDFIDDKSRKGSTYFDASPASAIASIRQQAKPVQYWGSWVDAGTADAALARFRSAPNVPTEVWITANSHRGTEGADPFLVGQPKLIPSEQEQFDITRRFAERLRRGEKVERRINYYVMGAGVFRQTPVWPPADAKKLELALGPDNSLVRGNREPGVDRYNVDFTATTGQMNRWTTNYGATPVYKDRRDEDRKLIVYDSEPMREATELVGTPVVTLHLASQSSDPAVFVYLEDVAPDGKVTYLTEGQLRAVHRKLADPKAVPYDHGPTPRTFKRADAQPVRPGEVMELRFALFPTAALIKPGHRLRVAIAGADAAIFRRHSNNGPEVFNIHRGGQYRSMIELTTRPFKND